MEASTRTLSRWRPAIRRRPATALHGTGLTRPVRRVIVLGVTLGLLLLSVSLVGSSSATVSRTSAGPAASTATASFPTPIQHVIVILMENQNASWVLQNGSYQRYLANTYSYAQNFYSVHHNSITDYYAVTAGEDWGTLVMHNTKNLADTTKTAGETWGGFFQSMPTACDQNATKPTFKPPTYAYTSGHNPFVWYSDVFNNKALCGRSDTGFGPLESDLASNTLPNYSLVIPDAWNDSHSPCPWAKSWYTNVTCGDSFLQSWLPGILNDTTASWYKSTAVILTYDEANTSDTRGIHGTVGGGKVYTVVAGPCARDGFVSSTNYSTYSILTTTEWLLNLPTLNQHDNFAKYPPMKDMFDTPSCGASGTSYTLITSASSSAGGSVSPITGEYSAGSPVTLRETPSNGYGFVGWVGTGTGSYTGTAPSPRITMNADITEVADFSAGALAISSFKAVPASIALGSPSKLEVTAAGGSGSFAYTYSSLPPGCFDANTPSLPCTPSSTGTYTVEVQVTDGLGHTAFANASLTVTLGDSLAFIETGLASGTNWSVTVATQTLASTTNTIQFYLPAGTQKYTIGPVPNEAAVKPSGSVSLTASGATVTVSFEHAYLVTFTESGLPPGTPWQVTLRTVPLSSMTNAITFWAPNGTFAYIIGAVSGYTSTGSPSSVVVKHATAAISVTFTVHGAMPSGGARDVSGPVLRPLPRLTPPALAVVAAQSTWSD